METSYNKETGIKAWKLTRWFEKTYYVLGIITFWWMFLWMFIAIIVMMAEELV